MGDGSNKSHKINRRMAVLVAALVVGVLVGGVASSYYAESRWWFPALASDHGREIDALFLLIMLILAVAFIVVHIFLALFAYNYADRGQGTGSYWHHNLTVEVLWTMLPAAVLTWLAVVGGGIWVGMHSQPAGLGPDPKPGEDIVPIEVMGQQFIWYFRYPGADDTLGAAQRRHISGDNPFGMTDDPAGRDDIVVRNELVMPVERRIHIRLRARDVIHSFFLPHFRVKHDAVPGRVMDVWLRPTDTGEYELACAELCGAGHFAMRSPVRVVTPEDYDRWLEEQATQDDTARIDGRRQASRGRP